MEKMVFTTEYQTYKYERVVPGYNVYLGFKGLWLRRNRGALEGAITMTRGRFFHDIGDAPAVVRHPSKFPLPEEGDWFPIGNHDYYHIAAFVPLCESRADQARILAETYDLA